MAGELCKNCGHKIKQYDARSVKIENIVQERNLLKHNLWGHQVGNSIVIRERCECGCLKPQPKPKKSEARIIAIAGTVAKQVIIDYHRENRRLAFWDILIFLRRNGLEYIIFKKHNRDAFFRYMKIELEKCLGIPIERDFNDKAGTTDNEYSNWFFKRSFDWGRVR